MRYLAKPYVVRRKLYSEQTFRNEAYFEHLPCALKEYDDLRALSIRDHVWVVDSRNGQVIADSRAK